MRNWNWIWEWRYPSVSIGCEPTYEELKLIFSILPPPCFCCCEPTYEELKPCANNSLICLSYCCEPTYEELKLYLIYRLIESMNPLRAYLWGIETYLYQISMGKCDSCEPTYEELKQRQSIPMDYLFYVASLPMRNWNKYLNMESIHRGWMLRAYLWGIETYQKPKSVAILILSCEPTYEELKL